VELLHWQRRAWADSAGDVPDAQVGLAIERITGLPRLEPQRGDGGGRLALDGGAIDVDGAGTVLATEQHLLSAADPENAGFGREDYERLFREYLGARRAIWLGRGCAGDLTDGHVDNVARFVAPGVVVLAYEPDPADANHERSADNLRRLELAGAADGRLAVVRLPFPRPLASGAERLPASYANFYIANGVVLVPTFNDPNDSVALRTLRELMPDRTVVGIPALQLLLGRGALHCITKEQPRC
jgi:agmatine deiminase